MGFGLRQTGSTTHTTAPFHHLRKKLTTKTYTVGKWRIYRALLESSLEMREKLMPERWGTQGWQLGSGLRRHICWSHNFAYTGSGCPDPSRNQTPYLSFLLFCKIKNKQVLIYIVTYFLKKKTVVLLPSPKASEPQKLLWTTTKLLSTGTAGQWT